MRFRMYMLDWWPECRVVRPSSAERWRVLFCLTWCEPEPSILTNSSSSASWRALGRCPGPGVEGGPGDFEQRTRLRDVALPSPSASMDANMFTGSPSCEESRCPLEDVVLFTQHPHLPTQL